MAKKEKLERERDDILYEIRDERSDFEAMVQRARIAGELASDALGNLVSEVQAGFERITQAAKTAQTIEELETAGDDADRQGQLRAYICPLNEVEDEGKHYVDLIAEWNVPSSVLDRLRTSQVPKLKDAASKPAKARNALRAIYQEHDSWDRYTTHYEGEMLKFSWILGVAVLVLIASAIVCFLFPKSFLAGLMLAGTAGACVSVLSRMPFIEVELSGNLESYTRRIISRVAVGAVASLIGCGLLDWGIINLSVGNMNFAYTANTCSTGAEQCSPLRLLVLVCVPLIFGFSERALTTFVRQFGKIVGFDE
jgi:hypothetical protein